VFRLLEQVFNMASASHRESVGAHSAQILGPDGQPVLRRPSAWKGLLLERKEIPIFAECGPQFSGIPIVVASRHSPGRRWYRCNGKTQEVPMIAPGVDFLGAMYERDHGRWECNPGGETINLQLHPSIIERYLHEDAYHFDLETKYCQKDDFLVDSLFTLADEMQHDMPNGTLYAEGLSLMIIGWLSRHYTSKPRLVAPQERALTNAQQAKVCELVDTHLDTNLSVERMAAEVSISPYHFSRLFRVSFGMPPHRYVMQMRIARAAQLLRTEHQRSISDIALSTGFASQAHLSNAFKCHLGQTPARWRAA
jgi:AraC family transcriptional regulator